MITIQANPTKIRAAIYFSATKDIRYYLKGILIEGEKEYTRIVSTNGSIVSIQGHKAENTVTEVFILPLATAKMISAKDTFCDFISNDNGKNWTMKTNSVNVNFIPIDGRFPDWRRIVPKPEYDIEQIPSQFDPELVSIFLKAAKILGQKTLIITHNKNGSGLVSINKNDFIGVIAPVDARYVEKNTVKYFDSKLTAALVV